MNRPTRNRRELCWGKRSTARRATTTCGSESLAFLRENRPSTYAELKASGELEHAVAWRLEEVKRFAENLIATGTHPPQAWNWAIRVKILGVEMD